MTELVGTKLTLLDRFERAVRRREERGISSRQGRLSDDIRRRFGIAPREQKRALGPAGPAGDLPAA